MAWLAPIAVHAAFPGVQRGPGGNAHIELSAGFLGSTTSSTRRGWRLHRRLGAGIDDFTSEEREFLAKSYPKTDIGKCWIFELDRRPASARALLVYFGGGTLILAIIALCAWLRRQREINSWQPVVARQQALREPVSQRR